MTKRSAFMGSLLALLLTQNISCSSNRKPAAEDNNSISFGRNLLEETNTLKNYINSPDLNAENCSTFLNSLYFQMNSVNPDYFDQEVLSKNTDEIVKNLWESQLALRKRVKEWTENGQMTQSCRDSVRTGFRTARVLEDYLMAMKVGNPTLNAEKTNKTLALAGGPDYFFENQEFGSYVPRTGDVFLSRGAALTSAAIARISEVDTNFSHLAILYIDEKTKKEYMVEAHIEVGSKVSTFETYKSDGKARVAIFRNPDAALAARSAEAIYKKVMKAQMANKNIPYDFGMDMSETNNLFCSEVVSYAYRLGSGGSYDVPLVQSGISMKNDQFLKNIGVTVKKTFAPADIELDTRFDFLGEWRDLKQIDSMHMMDMILTQIYSWMNEKNYRFYDSPVMAIGKYALWAGRRMPLFSNMLKEKFPKNMISSAIGTLMTLQSVGETLYEELEKQNNLVYKKTKHKMTPKQMADALESFRESDLKSYMANGQSKFHLKLRNPKDTYYPPLNQQ